MLKYGKLLLATGSNVRRLRLDGCDLDGIHYLRALGNADHIRNDTESTSAWPWSAAPTSPPRSPRR